MFELDGIKDAYIHGLSEEVIVKALEEHDAAPLPIEIYADSDENKSILIKQQWRW
jgi:hypothetical protein